MPPVQVALLRTLVAILALAGVIGQIGYLEAFWWNRWGLLPALAAGVTRDSAVLLTAHASVSIVSAAFASLVALRAKTSAAAGALALTLGCWSYLLAYGGLSLLVRPDAGLGRALFESHFVLVELVGLASLIRFSSLFPRVLHPEELQPSRTLPRTLVPVFRASVFLRGSTATWGAAGVVLAVLWTWSFAVHGDLGTAGLSPIMDLVRLMAVGITVVHFRRTWSVCREDFPKEMLWLLVALLALLASLGLVIGGGVWVAVTGFAEPTIPWRPILLDAGSMGLLTGVAVSVLGSDRWDPARVARRLAGATVIAMATLFTAAGAEALLAGRIVGSQALPAGIGTVVVVATVLAFARSLSAVVARALPQL